ncbi:uncharacterized protein V1516DRAFT_675579 [Lipomyces oligophaga]|uniref:uncharacterized protein n=1 Tax=Lipomyces oligophaga TaxID=45792 RepID=UPI0034CD6C57
MITNEIHSPKASWSTTKCLRVIRPLASKLNACKALIESHPSLVNSHLNANINDGKTFSSKCYDNYSYSSTFRSNEYCKKLARIQSRSGSKRYSARTLPKMERVRNIENKVRISSEFLLSDLGSKVSQDLFSAYRVIHEAYYHFLLQAYIPPRSLSQQCAIDVGKCVVHTRDSVFAQEWYDSTAATKLYKRFIAIGHGVSLICSEAQMCRYLLPVLILDSVELNALDMALLIFKSLLEVTPISDIIDQAEFFLEMSKKINAQPNVLLEYLTAKISVITLTHPKFIWLFTQLTMLSAESSDTVVRQSMFKWVHDISLYLQRQIRTTSHPQCQGANELLTRLACLATCYKLVDLLKQLKYGLDHYTVQFHIPWVILSLGLIEEDPKIEVSLPDDINACLATCIYNAFPDIKDLHIRSVCDLMIVKNVKFAVSLARVIVARAIHSGELTAIETNSLLEWRQQLWDLALKAERADLLDSAEDVEWFYDEFIEQWVQVEKTAYVVQSRSEVDFCSEDDMEDEDYIELEVESVSSQLFQEHAISSILPSPTSSSSTFLPSASQTGNPPSSVIRLTPRSARHFQTRFFNLVSSNTPAPKRPRLERSESETPSRLNRKRCRVDYREDSGDEGALNMTDICFSSDDLEMEAEENSEEDELTIEPISFRENIVRVIATGNTRLYSINHEDIDDEILG